MTRRGSKARFRMAIAAAVVLAANAILFAALTWPRLTGLRRAETRALAVADQRRSLENLWTLVGERKALVARNREDIDRLVRDYVKPRATDLFAAQREIDAMARAAGLKPQRSTYEIRNVKGTDLVRCDVVLPLEGSYADLADFLGRIETARRFLVVEQLALSEEERGARMSLKVSALFREGGAR